MQNDWQPKEYNKLADTDYKMEEYVRVPKEEYERLLLNDNKSSIAERAVAKHDKQVRTLQSKLDKIKEYVSNCTEEEYGADYFILKDYFKDILSIIESESE
jgi:hypothetical protein